jgi:hypothetical protein
LLFRRSWRGPIFNSLLDDDSLFSDDVQAIGLELGHARAFVLGSRLREITGKRDREVMDAFIRKITEDVHWTRFLEYSPWRYDEDELRSRADALRTGLSESSAD